MARYRKIDLRIHADEKYRRLTPSPPCGQTLWWHLIAGRQTGIIPGIFSIGEASFAEQLGWPLKGFREAFAEAFGEGMVEADWRSLVVWVPNAIRYNRPESPNVVRSWRDAWDEIPECQLKNRCFFRLKKEMEGLGEGFAKAFREAFGEALPKDMGESGTGTGTGEEGKTQAAAEAAKLKNPAAEPAAGITLPINLQNPEFQTAWSDWQEHRRQIKKPLTRKSAEMQVAKFAQWGPAVSIQKIQTSIANGWRGVDFPEHAQPSNGHAPAPRLSYAAQAKADQDAAIQQVFRERGINIGAENESESGSELHQPSQRPFPESGAKAR
jgi:hypothetical protein